MAREKDLIELMAGLPPDELARARQRNQRELERALAEVARLELQEQQFEMIMALTEKKKKPGRPGRLTAENVLEAAHNTTSPMTAADVCETFATLGIEVSVNAVRNHLNALVDIDELRRDQSKRYVLPEVATPAPGQTSADADFGGSADEDIPF